MNTASWSPLVVTLSILVYQPLRKFSLRFSLALPVSRSHVHFTSAEVKGLPSCQVTPCCRTKVRVLPSSLQLQLLARSGTMSSRLFWRSCWLNSTRLLNTPIMGSTTEIVPSSWIDMLAGLSRWVMRSIPPRCCACAFPVGKASASRTKIAGSLLSHRRLSKSLHRTVFITGVLPNLPRSMPVLGSYRRTSARPGSIGEAVASRAIVPAGTLLRKGFASTAPASLLMLSSCQTRRQTAGPRRAAARKHKYECDEALQAVFEARRMEVHQQQRKPAPAVHARAGDGLRSAAQ